MLDSLASSGDFDVYASLAAAETGSGVCRAIRCETAGTLVVKKGAGNATVAVTFKAGETLQLQIGGIVAAGSSGCVPILVMR